MLKAYQYQERQWGHLLPLLTFFAFFDKNFKKSDTTKKFWELNRMQAVFTNRRRGGVHYFDKIRMQQKSFGNLTGCRWYLQTGKQDGVHFITLFCERTDDEKSG